jgi:hypothetical protein
MKRDTGARNLRLEVKLEAIAGLAYDIRGRRRRQDTDV